MLPIEQIRQDYGHSMAVIIEACRVHFGTTSLEKLNELLKDPAVNYPEIALHSRLHRIRPVVFRILLQANCPDDIKARLKTELHSITLNNFSLAKETERIIQKLGEIGVTAIPYKGVAFSKQFYGDISMRESSDIDLVIEFGDLEKTFPFFKESGYIPPLEGVFKNLGKENFKKQYKDLCFDKKLSIVDSFHVELHWEVTLQLFQAPKSLNQFDRTGTSVQSLISSNCQFLNPFEHIRAISLHHMVHDGIEYIKTLIDLAQGLKRINESTDIELLKTKMVDMAAHYEMGAIWLTIEQLFGIAPGFSFETSNYTKEASKHVLHYNLNSTVGRYQRHRMLSLFSHYRRTVKNRTLFIKDLLQRKKFARKYWLNVISPGQGEKDIIKLPAFLHFLYFIIRPIRIALRKKSDA